MRFRQLLPLFSALFALYIIWGSTYFVIRIGVEKLAAVNDGSRTFSLCGNFINKFFTYSRA